MKTDNELLILIGLLVLMYINPTLMARFVNNILGKLIIVGCIIYLTEKHTILGLLLAVIFIAALQGSMEGMSTTEAASDAAVTNGNGSDDNLSTAAAATTDPGNEEGDSADDTGKPDDTDNTDVPNGAAAVKGPSKKKAAVTKENFSTLQPALVSSGRELISLDEMLRPMESNLLPANKPRGVPPSENMLAGQLDLMSPIKSNGTMNRGYLPAIF